MSAHQRRDHAWYEIRFDCVGKGGAEHAERLTPRRRKTSFRKPPRKTSSQMPRQLRRRERRHPRKQPQSSHQRPVEPAGAVENTPLPKLSHCQTTDAETAKNVDGADNDRSLIVPARSSQATNPCQRVTSAVRSYRHDLPVSSGTTRTKCTAAATVSQSQHWSRDVGHGIPRDPDECFRPRPLPGVSAANIDTMTTSRNSVSEETLYVCRECGDGIEDPNTNNCPRCGGPLVNSTVPHD
jgi:hypothetical protein